MSFTENYVNELKSYIMIHLHSSDPCPLEASYERLKSEAVQHKESLDHLEEAYLLVREEISGK